ncbi:hypothetical protein Z948_876 [Sulfitobacter donghicola DSW-25 = KCTC 12864 = JCM 14565]|nr:hypothetical protein Z948_876 [Sulfitobacter donghicola DSW-25 = KCTC 12864 = JCM 14565]
MSHTVHRLCTAHAYVGCSCSGRLQRIWGRGVRGVRPF